jgi:phosphohistidine phosphatase
MDLILWRHAEAEDAAPGQDDLERRLTAKGEKQAKRVAKWLREHAPKDLRILVSPAQRTQQTAAALQLPFETVASLSTDAGPDDLIKAAGWPGTDRAVLLVGHQPTLGETAAKLLTGRSAAWNIRKGALWWFSGEGPRADLIAVIDPRQL